MYVCLVSNVRKTVKIPLKRNRQKFLIPMCTYNAHIDSYTSLMNTQTEYSYNLGSRNLNKTCIMYVNCLHMSIKCDMSCIMHIYISSFFSSIF